MTAKTGIIVLLTVLTVLSGYSAPANPKEERIKYGERRELMGTYAQIDTCLTDENEARARAAYRPVWARLEDIAWRMNVFDKNSEVTRINQSYPNPVEVQADTYGVIKAAAYYNKLSKGAFDITVWPLIKLWKKSEKEQRLPGFEEIRQVQESLGPDNIALLENNQIVLKHPETRIDLGGIGAGYALDEAAKIFRANGVNDFFIDIGGDIYAGGKNCEEKPWRIGIRNPEEESEIIDIVALSDMAVTTSGDYEKFYEINGRRWSHIINPVTGYPQKGVVSATVIAPTGIDADALATAVCVMGRPAGTEMINSLGENFASLILEPGVNGQFIREENQIYKRFPIDK